MPDPFLRLPREGDGETVAKLLYMAHPDIPHEKVSGLARTVGNGQIGDAEGLIMRSRSRGTEIPTDAYFSMRIADSGTGRVAGFCYAGPPMEWIMSRGIGLPKRQLLATKLVEIQLMAVLGRFQGKGLGTALLADAEARYRQRGYNTAMLIIVSQASPLLVPWYEKHGYVFDGKDENYEVKFWSGISASSEYDHIQPGQRIAFKSLSAPAAVTIRSANLNHPGRAVPLTFRRPVASGLLD